MSGLLRFYLHTHLGAFQSRIDGVLPHHHPHGRPQSLLGRLPQEKANGLSCQSPYILRPVVPQLRCLLQHLHTKSGDLHESYKP